MRETASRTPQRQDAPHSNKIAPITDQVIEGKNERGEVTADIFTKKIENAPGSQVDFNGIPEGLKQRDQWVVWILAPPLDPKKEKPDKIPINVKTSKGARSTDQTTWATFDDARTFFEQKARQDITVKQKVKGKWVYRTGPVAGIGYVFSKKDPFTGVDLDDCIEGNGTPLPWADGIIKGLDSFTEVSVSGGGVHTIVEGKKPGAACRKGSIECYDQGRFFAITGRTLNGYKEINSRQKALDAFYHTHLQKPEPPPQPDRTKYAKSTVDTSTVMERIRRSRVASKIESLLHGNNDGHMSASEADQAACNHLAFFCGEIPDAEAYNIVDRIFRESSRYRGKWDQVHRSSDGATYGQMTIENALAGGERYRAKEKPAASPSIDPLPNPAQIRKRAEQILRDREPCGPFNLDVLPPLIRDYIRQICERTEADPVIVLSAVLSTLSALAGRRFYIPEGEYFSKLYSNLWFISIALSGDFKTTALNKGCRLAWQKEADIRERIRALEKKYTGEIDLLASEKETKKKKWQQKKAIKEIQAESCILPNRMSGEGLLELLSEGQGGMIPASEIGDWLSTLGASHNLGLKPLFTDLYDCPRQYSYKTRGGGHLIIQRPFISICGVSTMSWVQENISLKDIGSGFFARFLLFYPPQKRNVPPALPRIQGAFDPEIENKIKASFDRLQPDHPMTLKPSAARDFEKVHGGIYKALGSLPQEDQELLAPYSKRWSPYVLKLAMLFQAAIDPDDKIGREAIQAGTAVVEYAMKSTVHLFKHELGESPFQQQCRTVMEFISKKGGMIERHQLLTSKKLPGGTKEYDEVLSTLEDGNEITINEGSGKLKRFQVIRLTEKSKV